MSVNERFRIKELEQRSGLNRKTIHYYLREGLVPPPVEKVKNSAWYDESHVESLQLIRDLRENKFLPIKAIRAIIQQDLQADDFSQAQQETINVFRATLRSRDAQRSHHHGLKKLTEEIRFTAAEISQLTDMGWIKPVKVGGEMMLDDREASLLRAWAAVRDAGLTPRRGYTPKDFAIFDELLGNLATHETALINTRLGQLEPGALEAIYDRLVPALKTAIGQTHAIKLEQALMS